MILVKKLNDTNNATDNYSAGLQHTSHNKDGEYSPLDLAGATLLQSFSGGGPGEANQTGEAKHWVLRRR